MEALPFQPGNTFEDVTVSRLPQSPVRWLHSSAPVQGIKAQRAVCYFILHNGCLVECSPYVFCSYQGWKPGGTGGSSPPKFGVGDITT